MHNYKDTVEVTRSLMMSLRLEGQMKYTELFLTDKLDVDQGTQNLEADRSECS